MPTTRHFNLIRSKLRTGEAWTAKALSEELKCSEKTVLRAMDRLRDDEKLPIEAGKYGFRIRESSRAENPLTRHDEIAALAMAQEALRMLGRSELAMQLRAEIAMNCRLTHDLAGLRWEDLQEAVEQRPQGESRFDPNIHGLLTLAILQRMPVAIRYRRLEEDHDYPCAVFPHRLIHRDHCWYLIAHDLERNGQKTYSLPRINKVDPLPRSDDFTEPVFEDRYADAFGIWSAYDSNAPLQDVCVELSGYWARIAKEKTWHTSQRIEELAPDLVRVHFRVNELVQVKTWVLGFGGAAKVIAPDDLRELVCEEIAQMNLHYA